MKKCLLMIVAAGLILCFAGCNKGKTPSSQTPGSQTPNQSILAAMVGKTNFSKNYLVGFDYGSYDLYGQCPIVICKVRYDKKLEVDFTMPDAEESDIRIYDLTTMQYNNIYAGIDVKKIYTLDPQESNPEDVYDGGSVWLFVYGENDEVIKQNGGFCPRSEDFNNMRRVLFDNLPADFCSDYDELEELVMNPDNSLYYSYDIEKAVKDPVFVSIMENEAKPVKVVYGRGTENGYEQYISTEEDMIACITDSLRAFTIKEIIKDEVDNVDDSGEYDEITFYMEDGTKASVVINDKNTVHAEDGNDPVIYVFDSCNFLTSFENMMVEGVQF